MRTGELQRRLWSSDLQCQMSMRRSWMGLLLGFPSAERRSNTPVPRSLSRRRCTSPVESTRGIVPAQRPGSAGRSNRASGSPQVRPPSEEARVITSWSSPLGCSEIPQSSPPGSWTTLGLSSNRARQIGFIAWALIEVRSLQETQRCRAKTEGQRWTLAKDAKHAEGNRTGTIDGHRRTARTIQGPKVQSDTR